MQRIVYELRIHQIELEMQNEELRRAQVKNDASCVRYFDLYDLAPVGYCTLSEKGLFVEVNLNAVTLLGVDRGLLVRQPISNFLLKEDEGIYYEFRKQLFETGEMQTCELRMVKSDGAFFWAQLSATVTQNTEGAQVCRLVLIDIGERKQAEEVINNLLEAKNRFTAVVPHEIRSPLATIKEATNLVLEGVLGAVNDEQKDMLFTAKTHIDRLGRLVNNILTYQKIEDGISEYHFSEYDVNEVIKEADKSTMLFTGERKADFLMDLGVDLPKIKLDKDKIIQVLIKLLENAITFSKGGPVMIQTRLKKKVIEFSVRDSGQGIKPEQTSEIFMPFSRRLGKQKEGTGLGLAISKAIILAHHGKIWVESEIGSGSTFYFTLPV